MSSNVHKREQTNRERCVFVAVYKKVGVNQWIRIESPCIDIDQGDDAAKRFSNPTVVQVANALERFGTDRPVVEVFVFDEEAVDLSASSLLGDYAHAAERCEEALLRHFPNDVVLHHLSEW